MSSNTKGATTRDVNAAQRAVLALKLRSQKVTYDDIARMCGYSDRGAAHRAVQRELGRSVVESVEELRREELDSLERLELECWKRLQDKEYAKSMLFAVDRIVAIKERRAKLMGLDVPTDKAMIGNMVVIREVPNGYLAPVEAPKI
jgi:AraC-like DNA-binding protein